jgi:peptidoglycan/xylan/chitin deacetylase (PgdA/CDA1 family)
MMDRKLSENEIRYLLDHMAPLYTGADLGQYLSTDEQTAGASLLFPLSEKPLDESGIFSIREIPVLFPCSESGQWYSVEGKRVRFHHDILKSAFYLLSGFQEYISNERDIHGRYPWKSSIQYRLGITGKPVVNYYFTVIFEAFGEFCKLNGLLFRWNVRESPVLFLSHDVDRVSKYTFRNLAYAGLQLFGLKPADRSFSRRLKTLADYARGIFLFRRDPYWNFDELLEMEKQLNIFSTWYFLEKTRKDDSRYHFNDRKIRTLVAKLTSAGHEVGLHGTLESSEDADAMATGIQRLNAICDLPVTGIRQHYLRYSYPATARIQANAGLEYDATMGFAEQTGFRNSYASPFRLYDFEKDQPLDMWQLPLHVMDVTLLGYMSIPLSAVIENIRPLLQEVIRFGGVFSLLWHNCNLDEEELPGINAIYRQLLNEITESGFRSLTGRQVISAFRSSGVSDRNWSA